MYKSLEKGVGRDTVLGLLDIICAELPDATATEECRTFLKDEYDGLIKWLEQEYPPGTICTMMTLCDEDIDPISPACGACEVGFEFLENVWSFGPSEEVIEQLLNYVCYMFPENSTWRSECDAFLDQEFENLIVWIDKEFPPTYICTMIGACDFPVDPIDGVCEVCKGGFQFIYDVFDFDDDQGGDLAKLALDYICYMFPDNSTIRDDCTKFINTFYDDILKFLELDFEPEVICLLLNACDSPIDPTVIVDDCSMCKALYETTKDILGGTPTVAEVDIFTLYACNLVPQESRDMCTSFLGKY